MWAGYNLPLEQWSPSILRIGCALACFGDFLWRRRNLENCLLVFLSTGAWLDCAIYEWGVGFDSRNPDLAAMAGFRFVGRGNIGWCQLIVDWHCLCCAGGHLERTVHAVKNKIEVASEKFAEKFAESDR